MISSASWSMFFFKARKRSPRVLMARRDTLERRLVTLERDGRGTCRTAGPCQGLQHFGRRNPEPPLLRAPPSPRPRPRQTGNGNPAVALGKTVSFLKKHHYFCYHHTYQSYYYHYHLEFVQYLVLKALLQLMFNLIFTRPPNGDSLLPRTGGIASTCDKIHLYCPSGPGLGQALASQEKGFGKCYNCPQVGDLAQNTPSLLRYSKYRGQCRAVTDGHIGFYFNTQRLEIRNLLASIFPSKKWVSSSHLSGREQRNKQGCPWSHGPLCSCTEGRCDQHQQ